MTHDPSLLPDRWLPIVRMAPSMTHIALSADVSRIDPARHLEAWRLLRATAKAALPRWRDGETEYAARAWIDKTAARGYAPVVYFDLRRPDTIGDPGIKLEELGVARRIDIVEHLFGAFEDGPFRVHPVAMLDWLISGPVLDKGPSHTGTFAFATYPPALKPRFETLLVRGAKIGNWPRSGFAHELRRRPVLAAELRRLGVRV